MFESHLYHHLAQAFLHEGVSHCFALLGDANMNWAAALADAGCEFSYVRDEHCAVAAAMSWARTTGEVGVATVTCGPGLTQILTALPAAVRASIPMVIFAGEAPIGASWYNQQIDQQPFVEACGARYVPLHQAGTMCREVRDAFLLAQMEQTPVVLGVPADLQELPVDSDIELPQPSCELLPAYHAIPPNADELEKACTLVCNARRIVVMAGRGVVLGQAISVCEQFAEHVNGLLATTLPARGAFYNNPFSIGIAGGFSTDVGRACLQEADLVIAVGCSLTQHNSDKGKLFNANKVLHVDLKPLTLSQGRVAAAHHLRCDANAGMRALLDAVQQSTASTNAFEVSPWRNDALCNRIKNTPADSTKFDITKGLLDPRHVVAKLESVLPIDWFMVNSSGHCSYFFAQMPNRPVHRFLTIREFGAIGNGIAFAIGVARAHPERTVVLFDGDGSLLMHIQELETIQRHQLNILICVLNDGAYGSEIHKLRAEGLNDTGAVFGHVNLARIAKGFGIDGAVFNDSAQHDSQISDTAYNSLNELSSLLNSFQAKGGAAVWDFHVCDKVVSPVIRRSHQSSG